LAIYARRFEHIRVAGSPESAVLKAIRAGVGLGLGPRLGAGLTNCTIEWFWI